jgi:hypothetical protein
MADEFFYAKWERLLRELRGDEKFTKLYELTYEEEFRHAELDHLRTIIHDVTELSHTRNDPALMEVVEALQHFLTEREAPDSG